MTIIVKEIDENQEITFTICRLIVAVGEKKYYIVLSSHTSPYYLSTWGEIINFEKLEQILFSSYDECICQIEKYFTILSEAKTPKLYLEIEAHR